MNREESIASASNLPGGYIILDKSSGMSSASALNKVKYTIYPNKIGHAGTLDPAATGLLIVLLNGATRLASIAGDGFKTYQGEIKLGVRTSSDDLDGEILSTSEVHVTQEDLDRVREGFLGEISQVPPRVSAIKIGGQRAYNLERKGRDFELQPRLVTIQSFALTLLNVDTVEYRVECSPGTYVRSLARDIGELLGCGGAIATLRRARSGAISVTDGFTVEQLREATLRGETQFIRDWSELVPEYPQITVPLKVGADLLQGSESAVANFGDYADLALGVDRVIFKVKEHRFPLGILNRTGESWSYGINVASQFFLSKLL